MYQIRNFKRFKGHEGEPLAQGTLHGPQGKVADWSDDSWGGPLHYDFVTPQAKADFLAWAKGYLPSHLDYDKKPYDPSAMTDGDILETAIQQLSYAQEERKELEKLCKKGIAFRLRDADGSLALYTTTAAYTPENVAQLKAKHPNLAEVCNETLELPFVDGAAHALAQRNKLYKRLCKTCIVFTLKQPDGSLVELKSKTAYSSEKAKLLKAKYPNLVEIINERYL